jgi:Zn-dependent peptidase ImmA (M78 family)
VPRKTRRRVWREYIPEGHPPESRKDRLAREKAERGQFRKILESDLKETCSGMSLEEIAAHEGITIRDVGFLGGHVGKYRKSHSGQRNVILLVEGLTPKQREERVAHELAHYYLHVTNPRLMIDQDRNIALRPLYPRTEYETEADDFGKFLMSLSNCGSDT